MIIQALDALYGRLADDPAYEIAAPGYSRQKIGFKVVITGSGELVDVQDLRSQDSHKMPRQMLVPGGAKPPGAVTQASVGKKVQLLRNDLPFILGCRVEDGGQGDGDKSLVTADMQLEAFRDHHLAIEQTIDDDHFAAVCKFLRSWSPQQALQHRRHTEWIDLATSQGVFQLIGETSFVHERRGVRSWWDAEQLRMAADTGSPHGQCLVTGADSALARIHEPRIKGVRGAQSAGAALVTFNESAYESYGKEQSYNAPVSETVAFRYTTALNALTEGPQNRKHRLQLGDTTLLFWTERPSLIEDVFARFSSFGTSPIQDEAQDQGQLQKVEAFATALRRGAEASGALEETSSATMFFLLGLAPNQARVSVRFFQRGSVNELLERLRAHCRDIEVLAAPAAGKRPADPEFPSLRQLLDQACPLKGMKPDRDRLPPNLSAPLLRAVLTGARYPDALYSAAMRRIRAGDRINYLRACLISGALRRNQNMEIPVSLDTTKIDPGYRLGRLFAALEKTQLDGLGNVNATIRDRFYGSASATPRTVFPRLLRTYQHHLSKLEGGKKVNREKLVQEILGEIREFPAHLSMAAQGLFALGYYHQTQDFYTKKERGSRPTDQAGHQEKT